METILRQPLTAGDSVAKLSYKPSIDSAVGRVLSNISSTASGAMHDIWLINKDKRIHTRSAKALSTSLELVVEHFLAGTTNLTEDEANRQLGECRTLLIVRSSTSFLSGSQAVSQLIENPFAGRSHAGLEQLHRIR